MLIILSQLDKAMSFAKFTSDGRYTVVSEDPRRFHIASIANVMLLIITYCKSGNFRFPFFCV